ncbi:MAG: ATP-grasp domain-containing protein [Leptospirales bacterium]|nr:ATP-grasp domain-containing protein [Leptospirales bacterium]
MKKVLCISLGWEQEPQLRALSARADVALYGIHYHEPDLPGIHFEKVLTDDLRDLSRMAAFANSIEPDAVISDEDDYGAMVQALVAERFDLPGPRVAHAQLGANKFLQRTRAAQTGLKIPAFQLCSSLDDVVRFAQERSFPLMLKPVDNRGSIGASRVNSKVELSAAFSKALCASPSWLVIAEDYIEGDHFNVDGYCFSGVPQALAVSRNVKSTREIVNDSIVYGDVPSNLRERLMREGERTARALGYNFGFFHGEFILSSSDGQIYLTEMANRGGGILISQLILPAVTNLDLVQIYIADCMRESISHPVIPQENYVRIDFAALDPGKVFAGFREQLATPQLIKVVPFLKEGSVVPDIENGAQRHIMLVSSQRDSASIERLKESLQRAVIYK